MRYIILFAIILIPIKSYSQDSDLSIQRLQDKIERLERDLNILQKEYYTATPNNKKQSLNPSFDVRLTELEEQIRDLNGNIEQNQFQIQSTTKKIDKIINDIDYRITEIEQKQKNNLAVINPGSKDKQSVILKEIEAASLTKTSSSNSYEDAFEYLRKSNYVKAESHFKKFIESHENNPNHELLSNAYYWLGETYYVRENYETAAVNFLKGYKGWKKGNKAPDNLLKLAMSLDRLKKTKEACTTFNKVIKEFPKADSDITDQVEREKSRINCK